MAAGNIKINSYNNTLQKIYNFLPGKVVGEKATGVTEALGRKITPAENRLILGATALLSQPFIDANNKNVDEKTRKVSVARTIAKIIAGTLTGFTIRKASISAIAKWSKIPKDGMPKLQKLFTPKDVTSNTTDAFKQYQNALGNVIALVVMMVTNFAIDAPLTRFLTNLLVEKSGGNDEKSK